MARPLWREALIGLDWLSLRASAVYRGVGTPRGDNSAVVIIPGFLGNDQYLGDLFAWLRRIGYQPYMSAIGRNAECLNILAERLLETTRNAYNDSGRKVHLIGHSLGGVLARGIANQQRDLIASVVTMGSPFRGVRIHPLVLETASIIRGRILSRRNGQDVAPECFSGSCSCDLLKAIREGLPEQMARLAIYTKADGVVDWQCCIDDEGDTNVEVGSTHVGMAFNPQAYRHIADFLAAPETYSVNDTAASRTA
jgi:pimeloyl-ACP methyl ester carboxylesterase